MVRKTVLKAVVTVAEGVRPPGRAAKEGHHSLLGNESEKPSHSEQNPNSLCRSDPVARQRKLHIHLTLNG